MKKLLTVLFAGLLLLTAGCSKKDPDISEPFSDFVYHIHPTIDFTRKLLSYGQYVQVISPAGYALQVASIVRESAKRYK